MEHGSRAVQYANKQEIKGGIMRKYRPEEYAVLLDARNKAASGGAFDVW